MNKKDYTQQFMEELQVLLDDYGVEQITVKGEPGIELKEDGGMTTTDVGITFNEETAKLFRHSKRRSNFTVVKGGGS